MSNTITAEQRLIENVAESKRQAAEQAKGFVTYSGATVKIGDVVTGVRYEGVRRFTITVTGIDAGPGMVHGLIHGAKGGAYEGDYTGTTSLDIATVEPVEAETPEEVEQADVASMAAAVASIDFGAVADAAWSRLVARRAREAAAMQAEAALADALHDAPLGSLLVQDTTEHGVQIVAVKLEPGDSVPWAMVATNSRRNAGALAHMSRAMPNLRIVAVDVEAGR